MLSGPGEFSVYLLSALLPSEQKSHNLPLWITFLVFTSNTSTLAPPQRNNLPSLCPFCLQPTASNHARQTPQLEGQMRQLVGSLDKFTLRLLHHPRRGRPSFTARVQCRPPVYGPVPTELLSARPR